MSVKINTKVKKFKVSATNELEIDSSDLIGKSYVIYFYPKDNTPGCTLESCNLRDHYVDLKNKGFEVLGVSADSEASHQKFIKKHKLPFHLLADTEKEVLNAYGVWGPKKFMGRTFDGIHRTTFVIDENGIIERVFTKVQTKQHTEQILESYQ